jgi:hypothetical protein
MRHGAAVHAVRLTGKRANRVEIVNRVVQDLETRCAAQERPLRPWLSIDDAHFDVGHRAEPPIPDQTGQYEHVRTEAQLKVDRRHQPPVAAGLEDQPCRVEVLAHRLLNQNRRAFRQPADDRHDLIAGDCDVEYRIAAGYRFIESGKHARQGERSCRLLRRVRPDVEDAGDWQSEPLIRGEVSGAHDGAGADDDDRARIGWNGPRLPKVRHHIFQWRLGPPASARR